MGSHGGATAEGQIEMLAGYNITEQSIGVPIKSCMDVVQYDALDDGTPLYCDKNAWSADGIVVFNKVKPHTDFRGAHESGLAKMIAIGLAKHKGASMNALRDSAFLDLGHTKFDTHRALRNGFPEVVYAEGKTPEQVAEIFCLPGTQGNILATRVSPEMASHAGVGRVSRRGGGVIEGS